jgi:hypothetical protein
LPTSADGAVSTQACSLFDLAVLMYSAFQISRFFGFLNAPNEACPLIQGIVLTPWHSTEKTIKLVNNTNYYYYYYY